jgi:hypothetical protein
VSRVWLGISPIIPTIASLLLAALWGLSVFAGWGLQAFCSGGESAPACSARLATVAAVSGLFAVAAACCTAAAWLIPMLMPVSMPVPVSGAGRTSRVFGRFMGAGLAAWVAAEGVLFLGGLLAR